MNWQHFRAFLWLRWRLRVNQLRRAGTVNAAIAAVLAVAALFLSVFLFVGSFLLGLYALPEAAPTVLLIVWDGLVVAFLFVWTVGVLADLQRSEVLSLDKFLHLPVSLTGAFLVNYLSSLVNLTLIVFVPAMVGLNLGLAFAKGPAVLLSLPLLAAFLLMVTGVTHQFRGWLASIMVNPRRRRTVIAVATMVVVLLVQLPNLMNFFGPWRGRGGDEAAKAKSEAPADLPRQLTELDAARAAGRVTAAEYERRRQEIRHESEERGRQARQRLEWVDRMSRVVNLVLPPGWLPLGVMASAEGDVLPPLLGTAGLALIGTASLWRSYRTTLRLYTGQFGSGKRRPVAPAPAPTAGRPSRVLLLERHLPWVSEEAAAIALGGFRSLTRAAEAKMMLLTPLIMLVLFGSMLLARSGEVPEAARPLLAFGAMGTVLLSMIQLVGNQFGFDRSGFRVFVLCGASRRDVLLGKNLAFAPLALGIGAAAAVVVQCVYPMRVEHFLAVVPQFVSMYLLFCMLANWLSILAPMPIAAGSLRPANTKAVPVLLHVLFVFLFPLVLAPTLLPLGVEFALESVGLDGWVPVCLLLSLLGCAAVVLVYLAVLSWQGASLQGREKKILEVVASKAE